MLAWLTPLLWPFLRALALFSALPVLGQRNVPMRVRVALAAFIAAAAPGHSAGAAAWWRWTRCATAAPLVAQQMVIGLALGFSVRLVFAAVEFAGELVGLQMGLNFAGFFDPISAGTATPSSRFFGTTIAWLFIVINGHLIVIAALAQSFDAFPVGPEPFAFLRQVQPHRWGAEIFSTGLWIALPLVTMLLFVNLVLGAVSRVAPQINIFAVGFPVTLGVGLLGLVLTLPALQQPFTMLLERVLTAFR
ncbi:MAG: flagellar biosynthetic protein FliR [Rubrivivax sp.]